MGRSVRSRGGSAAPRAGPPEREADAGLVTPGAFGAFYDDALPRVYGYFVARSGGDRGVAEELTQETFLAAVAAIPDGRRIGTPLPWLFGITRHKLLDHYRREAREARAAAAHPVSWDAWREAGGEGGGEGWEADGGVFGPAAWAGDGWRERTLAALAALPAAQRQALTLRHLDEMTVPEVTAALERSVHATESLLARGRAGFKRAWAAGEEDGDG